MELDQQAILSEIDAILQECGATESLVYRSPTPNRGDHSLQLRVVLLAAIDRLSPPDSAYRREAHSVPHYSYQEDSGTGIVNELIGILNALRADYAAGRLRSVQELIHAETFADFLEMAQYLLSEDYKDAAAVLAGGVLEGHLRALCQKHAIAVVRPDGQRKRAANLNTDLAAAGVYGKLDQQSVTTWLHVRNSAAHALYGEYTKEQVALMVQGIQDFATRHPA